jgi:hypothetical protein
MHRPGATGIQLLQYHGTKGSKRDYVKAQLMNPTIYIPLRQYKSAFLDSSFWDLIVHSVSRVRV